MLATERHRKIVERLERDGSVKVSELGAEFQVTEKTIREDLEKLEQKGLLKRTHGGAVLEQPGEDRLWPLQIPNARHQREKEAIADYAVSCIAPDDIVALDAGSTTLEIAKRLKSMPLTVLTNDLLIIRELTLRENIRLVVPGGYRHRNMLVGNEANEWVKKLNVHKLFLSTSGIHPEYGLTIFTEELTRMKRVFIECAKTVYCVADHAKFDKGALITFAKLNEVHHFITDDGLTEERDGKYRNELADLVKVPFKK